MIDLNELIKEALKLHDDTRLRVYRCLKAEVQKYETSKGSKPLTDAKQLEIFSKYAKTLEDSILEFSKAGRDDLFSQYTLEHEVVKSLLPAPVSRQELKDFMESDDSFFDPFWTIVEDYTDDTGTDYTHMELRIPKKMMGATIKYIKSKYPTADGKLIADLVAEHLTA